MNYDLDTEEGMQNAMEWTARTLSHIKQGGTWAIPRSGTLVKVDHENKCAYMIDGSAPEESTERVLVALGWHVVHIKGETND
jgi:hypothetical protein